MGSMSAGILMYRHSGDGLLVLLVHPGGPFWRNRDLGAWSIPKGEFQAGEDPQQAARREFAEELGVKPTGLMRSLGEVRQRGGKKVFGYALKGTLDVDSVRSNKIPIEWPPRSGRTIEVPEIDRAEWFALPLARQKILAAQQPFLDRLEQM
ncbi:MAG: NUDIX domain-containing protein [Bradyrhizobium sp.]|jgi:predicted NUDIX family NTP pyrophosphohydrolase